MKIRHIQKVLKDKQKYEKTETLMMKIVRYKYLSEPARLFSYGHMSNAVISQHLVLVAAVEAMKCSSWEYLLPTIKVTRDSAVTAV